MREKYLKAYIGILLVLASTLAASWVGWYGVAIDLRLAVGALVFAGLVLVGDAFPIRISGHTTIGTWDIGLVVGVATLGPTWTAIAALPAALFVGKRDWLRVAFEVGHSVTIVYLAGIAFSFSSAPLLLEGVGSIEPTAQIVYGTFAASLTLIGVSKVIMIVLLKVKYNESLQKIWKENFESYLYSDTVNLLTAGLGVLAMVTYGPVATVVVVAGSIASQILVYRSRDQVHENRRLQERIRSLEESLTISNTTFGIMMIQDLGRKDGYTDRHAIATAVYSADLGREMKLDDVRVERLRMAGLLHNIGLFSLPEELLLTPGRLNSIAKSQISEHPVRGEQALATVPELKEIASWVRWHHERIDGRGYPDKLRGPWIPSEAKILAVAQAYAAMVLDKPHRPGLKAMEAREKLTARIDTEFDGAVVRDFLRILDTETEGYRMADDHRFVFPAPETSPLKFHQDFPQNPHAASGGEDVPVV